MDAASDPTRAVVEAVWRIEAARLIGGLVRLVRDVDRAEASRRHLGVHTLQAAIAGCHARARRPQDTEWPRIVALYDALAELTGSPVVELNRALPPTLVRAAPPPAPARPRTPRARARGRGAASSRTSSRAP